MFGRPLYWRSLWIISNGDGCCNLAFLMILQQLEWLSDKEGFRQFLVMKDIPPVPKLYCLRRLIRLNIHLNMLHCFRSWFIIGISALIIFLLIMINNVSVIIVRILCNNVYLLVLRKTRRVTLWMLEHFFVCRGGFV